MDFLDPKKKRAHNIRLLVGYFLMAIAISIGTLILLLEAFGYDLYNRNGEVIQNGLVFVNSRPSSADILVNGRSEGTTDKRLVLPESNYKFQLRREGYRIWERNLNLAGHMVVRMTYPLMIPSKLETENLFTLNNKPRLSTQSPDKRWLLIFDSGEQLEFQTIDLDKPLDQSVHAILPSSLMSVGGKKHIMKVVEWSNDNRHVLVRHDYQGGTEYLLVDRVNPEESFNVSTTFNLPIKEISLRDKKYDRFQILDIDRNLWLGEAPAGRLTPLAENVIAYKSHGSDVLLYATPDEEKKNMASIKILIEGNTYELRELPLSSTFVLDLAMYDDRWYFVVGTKELKQAYVYRQPIEILRADSNHPAPVTVLRLDKQIDNLSFSANARFIGAHANAEFTVYDAEHDRQYRYDVNVDLEKNYKAEWMDGHRYSVVNDGKVTIFDFDGSNRYDLSDSAPGSRFFFDRDSELLFTFIKNSPGNSLSFTRTYLLIESER